MYAKQTMRSMGKGCLRTNAGQFLEDGAVLGIVLQRERHQVIVVEHVEFIMWVQSFASSSPSQGLMGRYALAFPRLVDKFWEEISGLIFTVNSGVVMRRRVIIRTNSTLTPEFLGRDGLELAVQSISNGQEE